MLRRIAFGAVVLILLFVAAGGGLKGRLTPFVAVLPRQARIEEVLVNKGVGNIVFDIEYPEISGFGDRTFEKEMNAKISAQVNYAIADAFYRAKGNEDWVFVLRVSDDVKNNLGILCVRVTDDLDNGGTGFPHTVYYNADIQKSDPLTLDDLFVSNDYRMVIDGFIREIVRNDSHYFADAFTGVSESTAFYLSEGQLHIAYAKYEIASGFTGEPDFEIPTLLIRKWLKSVYAPLFW